MPVTKDICYLNRRFALWIGCGVCLPVCIIGYLWINHLQMDVERELKLRQEQVLTALSSNMLEPLQVFLPETASMQVRLLMQDEAIYSVRVYSGLFEMDLVSFSRTNDHDSPILFTRKHLFSGGEVLGFVELAFSRTYMYDRVEHRRDEVLVCLTGIAAVITLILYVFYWKHVIIPVTRLRSAADTLVTGGEYERSLAAVPLPGDDALDTVLGCMESMRATIHAERMQVDLLTVRDPATRIPYHDLFMEMAERELALAGRFGVPVCLVLFSHDTRALLGGDELYRLAQADFERLVGLIRPRLRPWDVLGHWDNKVFAVLMPERTQAEAVKEAEQLCSLLADRFVAAGQTISFGVASFWGTDTMAALFKRADAALYQAVDAGGNCVKTP